MKILLVIKHSKFEWDQKRLNITPEELKNKLAVEGVLDAVIASHECQISNREYLLEALNILNVDYTFCMMDQLKEQDNDYDLIIAFGGDNSFTYISHFNNKSILCGVNSDPKRSIGYLTKWKVENIQDACGLVSKLTSYDFRMEYWPRVGAELNGQKITPATSEYFFGEKQRTKMSRHTIEFQGQVVEQKCSGLLVATGAGSTGWFKSISASYSEWRPTDPMASFVITEPYGLPKFTSGIISGKERLIIKSLNDGEGIISIDSWKELEFNRGNIVEVFIDTPLKIAVPK